MREWDSKRKLEGLNKKASKKKVIDKDDNSSDTA